MAEDSLARSQAFSPQHLSLAVLTRVTEAKNAGVRRPGNEAKLNLVSLFTQSWLNVITTLYFQRLSWYTSRILNTAN